MAYGLPNGSEIDLASVYGSKITISSISNADPAVVSATGHSLADGDFVELTTSWTELNGRVFRVANTATGTFELEDVDTSDVARFPAGLSAGSCRKIQSWVRVNQATGINSSGGEQQYTEFTFVAEKASRRIPTTRSASNIDFVVADDPAQAFIPVAEKADRETAIHAVRLTLPAGDVLLYNGYISITDNPTMNLNELRTRTLSVAQSGRLVRYNA